METKKVKVTKKATKSYLRNMLATNATWAYKALIIIYGFQTEEEKSAEITHDLNGVGFTGTDGVILSSFAKQLIKTGSLSPKQHAITMNKMSKYWQQILEVSNKTKLHTQVETAIFTGKIK